MKKALYLLFAVSAATFFACSDDSSSDNGVNGGSGTVTETTTGSIVLDEANQTFTAVAKDQEELCVKEGFDYSWKTVDWGDDSIKFKYEFVGDTLVLYRNDSYYDDEDYSPSHGQMYVGGKGGSLNGTWKSTLCSYSAKEGSTCAKACKDVGGKLTEEDMERYYEQMYASMDELTDEPEIDQSFMDRMSCVDENDYAEVTLKISGTSFTATEKYHYEQDLDFDDYTNSRFMARFYESLIRKDPEVPSLSYLFREDSAGVKEFIEDYEKYKVTVASQTKKSITFNVMETENITITVDEVSASDYSGKVTMTLKTSTGSCKLLEEEGEVSKKTCSTEYDAYFEMDREKDATGKEINYAEYFARNNEREFESCAEDLMDSLFAKFAGKSSTSDNPLCDSYKEAYDECVAVMGADYCESYQYYYESCLEGGEYSSYDPYEDYYEEGDWAPLYKKASSAVSAAKAKNEKIVKTSRKIARSLRRIAQ
jgi:hypothetical protein